MNPILEYYNQIENGEVEASRKIKITYWFIVNHMFSNPKYEYRDDLAQHAINFIQDYCRHSKGKAGGKPFLLELWQKAMICTVFGIVFKGKIIRKHRIVMLIVGRKNGKSTLAAAISLYLLIADSEAGPEIYAVATQRDQAKIIWSEAVKMIKKSPKLRRLAKARVGDIITNFNEGSYRPLGRDSKALDGLNPHGATMDEIEAWMDMNMFDVIVDGASARDNWLVFLTSTAGFVREAVWDSLYKDGAAQVNAYTEGRENDEATIYFIYELDKKEEWREEINWQKANPGLGTIKNITELRRKVENAKRDSAKISNLVTKDFNIPETASSAWLNLEDIQVKDEDGNIVVRDFKLKHHYPDDENALQALYGIGGIDLSITTDLTCATVIFQVPNDENIYVKQMYWIPDDLLEDNEVNDKVPYVQWYKRGLLRTCAGNKIRHEDIYDWFVEIQETDDIYIYKIGYDSYTMSPLKDKLENYFGKEALVPVHQGVKTLSGPMYALGADIKAKKIIYGDNPILEWCLTNVKVLRDNNGNIKPEKIQNRKHRIDGLASLLDAYVILQEHNEEYMAKI